MQRRSRILVAGLPANTHGDLCGVLKRGQVRRSGYCMLGIGGFLSFLSDEERMFSPGVSDSF